MSIFESWFRRYNYLKNISKLLTPKEYGILLQNRSRRKKKRRGTRWS